MRLFCKEKIFLHKLEAQEQTIFKNFYEKAGKINEISFYAGI